MKKKKGMFLGVAALSAALLLCPVKVNACGYTEVGEFGRPFVIEMESEEEIAEEIYLGELEELAQLVEAEAGNQGLYGKRLVVDVVLNRVESDDFPDNIHDVIFQEGQFSVVTNGAWEKAAYNMKESDYEAVKLELELHENKEVLYFNCNRNVAGTGEPFKVGGHWFNT